MAGWDHLRRGRHEKFQGGLSVDELAHWCVIATYRKAREQRSLRRLFQRKPRHLAPEHPYHRGRFWS